MAMPTAVTVATSSRRSSAYRRRLDSVIASTSVRPDTKASTYSPRLPAKSDSQAAASSTSA